jgi:hypothetical protein
MSLNSMEVEATIMDVTCVAQVSSTPTHTSEEGALQPNPALPPNDQKLVRAQAAAKVMRRLLGSLSEFERDVLTDIVHAASEMTYQGLSEWVIRKRVRKELLGLIETVKSMAAEETLEGLQVDIAGELESLDGEVAVAWVQVSPGLRVKSEMPAELFEGVNLKPGKSFVIEPGGARAQVVKDKRVLSAEDADAVAQSLIRREVAYREEAKTQEWRFATDED